MENLNISQEYLQAVKVIKQTVLESRYRAARLVNKEILALNYGIGKFISINSRTAQWGSNAISVISKLLQQELPGIKGYSEASIKMMRTFYEEWKCLFENRQLIIDDFQNKPILYNSKQTIIIRQLATDELSGTDLEHFLNVGFTNHYVILTKTQSLEERLFYIRRCATEFWKVETTKYYLNEKLYYKEGSIQQTNFDKTIEDSTFKMQALQSFKDEYMLDFVNIEDPEIVDERVIEQKNEEIVELSFSDTSKPMGVATYRTSQELPQQLREALPSIEDLKKLL